MNACPDPARWTGWTWGRDGLLYAPGWRRGLEPGDILALPYLRALAAHEARRAAELIRQIDDLEKQTAAALEDSRRLRRLVMLESRLGLMLASVTRYPG